MALHGALAENQRRNERVDRGVVSVPVAGTLYLTLDNRPNSGLTLGTNLIILANPYGELGCMRVMTAFQLTVDDNGTRLGSGNTIGAIVSGNINSTTIQPGGASTPTYAVGTVLTINVYAIGSTGLLVAPAAGITKVRFQIWGVLAGDTSF